MELTDKNYETIIKNNEDPVFIDFYSPTCGPCQMLTKLIDERLEQYGEENGVKVVKNSGKKGDIVTITKIDLTLSIIALNLTRKNGIKFMKQSAKERQ